jgi:hypothetical protein
LPGVTPFRARLAQLLALLAVLAIAGLAAGCGDDDGGDAGSDKAETTTQQTDTQPTTTEEAEPAETTPETSAGGGGEDPEGTFLAFQNALADGDADAVCGSLTPSGIKQVEAASIGGKCDTWVEEISKLYDPASKAKLRKTEVDSVAEKGDKATIKYVSPILNLPLEVEVEKDGDAWKISKLGENV